MPVPATTGKLCATIQEMEIGDYIIWKSIYGVLDYDFVDNINELTEVPITGQVWAQDLTNYYWYGVKIAKGLIVSDRIVKINVSWDTLNSNKLIQGKPETLGGVSGIIRSLTGGVAYADVNGNKSTTDQGTGLTFPTINEFDKYILGFDQTKIQSGKTLADVFHHDVIKTWTQDTPIISIAASTNRVARGGTTGTNNFSYLSSSTANTTVGFRPVFEYQE